MVKTKMTAEFHAMSPEEVVAQVRAILDPGPWQVITNFSVQGYALWELQGKLDKPWVEAKHHTRVKQCTACGAIFGGVSGFTKHRTGMRCNNPADIGLTRSHDGVWRLPVPVFATADGVLDTLSLSKGTRPLPRARAITRGEMPRIRPEDVTRLRELCRPTSLSPAEARAMDDLLRQQAMDRIRLRGWSIAGPNKVLGKLATLDEAPA